MRYVDEFRKPELITKASKEIRRLSDPTRHYRIMEVEVDSTANARMMGLNDGTRNIPVLVENGKVIQVG